MNAAVHAYIAAWSEHDPGRRDALLRRCWTEASEIIGPGYRFQGVQAVLDEIARFHRDRPDQRAVTTSGVEGHGPWRRFTIALLDTHGTVLAEGWDVVELAEDGRVKRVITFWGPLPPTPTAAPGAGAATIGSG